MENNIKSSSETINFDYYKTLEINHSKVAGSGLLEFFPVLIGIYDSDLHDFAQYNGNDVAFGNDTSIYNFEIELFEKNYNETHARLIAWVEIPTLSPDSNTIFFMYYGNNSMSSLQNPIGVWNSSYTSVWHLNNNPGSSSPGSIIDSTSNGFHGTPDFSMTPRDLVTGKIGLGIDLDGNDDFIDMGNVLGPNDEITLFAWVNPDFLSGEVDSDVIQRCDSGNSIDYSLSLENNDIVYSYASSGSRTEVFSDTSVSTNEWQQIVITVDSNSTVRFYRNGLKVASKSGGVLQAQGSTNFILGTRYIGTGNYFDGTIDEIRVANNAKSDDWIGTEFNNQNDPANFILIGEHGLTIEKGPDISINAPKSFEIYGDEAPYFNIEITDEEVDFMWYSLDEGITKYYFTENGSINQEYWKSLPSESVKLIFYANNSKGETSFRELILLKRSISNIEYFRYYKEILINHSLVSGTGSLENFPVLISIYDQDLQNWSQSSGNDICFATQNNWLSHEIEDYNQTFNATHASLKAWVRIPSLSTSQDTRILMYFGNSTIDSQANPMGVWASSYAGVWHLSDEPNPSINDDIKDSTLNELHGNSEGIMTNLNQIDGIIDGSLFFDGNDDFIDITEISSNVKSVSFWIKPESLEDSTIYNTDFFNPSATGDDYNGWTNPQNAYLSDDLYSTAANSSQYQDWYNFDINIPDNIEIKGIQIGVEGNDNNLINEGCNIELSWDGGNTYTSTGNNHNWTGGLDLLYLFGGSSDTWLRNWTSSELSNSNFRVKLGKIGDDLSLFSVDHITIRVYYSENIKLIDFNGEFGIEINQSDHKIIDTNFPGVSMIFTNGTLDKPIDNYWCYITITNSIGINISTIDLGRIFSRYFEGIFDEFRISNIVKSPSWIITEFNNQHDPNNFYTLSESIRVYSSIDITCYDHDGDLISDVNISLYNASNNQIWDNPINNSAFTDENGQVVFEKLKSGDYNIRIYFGERYDKSILLKELNLTLTDDEILIVEHLNLTRLDLTFYYEATTEPFINAKVSFFEDDGIVDPNYIGYEISDFEGKITFIWLNKSQDQMNYTFNLEKLGMLWPIHLNGTSSETNLTVSLENYTEMVIFVSLLQDSINTFLNLEYNTENLMNEYYWGEIISLNVSYEWEYEINGTRTPIFGALIEFNIIIEENVIYSGFFDENGAGHYGIQLDSQLLGLSSNGTSYTVEIHATKISYDDVLRSIILELKNLPTVLSSEDGIDSFEISWFDNITFNVRLFDSFNLEWISDADLTFEEKRYSLISGNLIRNPLMGLGWYNFTLNSLDFPSFGFYTLEIEGTKSNYETTNLELYVNILQVNTFINGTIFLPLTYEIDVTTDQQFYFNYSDENFNQIENVDVLTWELQDLNTENSIKTGKLLNTSFPGIYKVFGLDTSQLRVGTYSIVVRISKENYVERQSAISLSVRKIPVLTEGITPGNIFSESKGNIINVSLSLLDSLYYQPLENAIVTIYYNNENHTMNQSRVIGEYYHEINTDDFSVFASTESFSAIIFIEVNENFTSEEFSIIIQITPPTWLFGVPVIYWIIGGGACVFMAGVFITYRTVTYARIPLIVKKIDSTTKSIKRKKKFKQIGITRSRKDIAKEFWLESYSSLDKSTKKSSLDDNDKKRNTKTV